MFKAHFSQLMPIDGLRKVSFFLLIGIFLFPVEFLSSCKPRYGQSKSMKRRKRKLKRKYKKSGIDDCPVFDCRAFPVKTGEFESI